LAEAQPQPEGARLLHAAMQIDRVGLPVSRADWNPASGWTMNRSCQLHTIDG
jgi:hypothetical protein